MSSRSAYIPLHGDVFSNKKTIAAANELTKGDVEKMVGHLARLWTWAVERNDDGNLSHLTDPMIAEAAGWRGKPARFVEAITTSGLLDVDRRLHDWDDYAGMLVDRRERDRDRKRRERTEAKATGTFPASSGGRPKDSPSDVRTQRTEPNRTEPERREGANANDASGQVSALSASRGTTAREVRGARLSKQQFLVAIDDFADSQYWPLEPFDTRTVLETLANDQDLPDGDLAAALTYYNDYLESSPIRANTVEGVVKALRPWLTSWLRRSYLGKLMHEKRGSNDILADELGTDQYGEMSNDEIEQAIAVLEAV